MLFDTLCNMTERHGIDFARPQLMKASLFSMDDQPIEKADIPLKVSDTIRDFLAERFFLPFPVVAVNCESQRFVVVLVDAVVGEYGLGRERLFLNFSEVQAEAYRQRVSDDPDVNLMADKIAEMADHAPEPVYCLIFGKLTVALESKKKLAAEGIIIGASLMSTSRMISPFAGGRLTGLDVRTALDNPTQAISWLYWYNVPSRWCVEGISLKAKRRKKIPRSHERPQHSLLTEAEVAAIVGPCESAGLDDTVVRHRDRHYTFRPGLEPGDFGSQADGSALIEPATLVCGAVAPRGKRTLLVRMDV